jgi:dTDP-4-dehydrorhamnose 3,5-epimerase
MVAVIDAEEIAGVQIAVPEVHGDDRGLFLETWRREWFRGGPDMVQQNRADRRAGAVVGLHFHLRQSDYWYVPAGSARVVLHDLRVGSPTEGSTLALDLGGQPGTVHDHRGVLIPPGVAHGFAAITDMTITYLVDRTYDPADELSLAWDDPEVAADWGVVDPVLSERDRLAPRRCDLPAEQRPRWAGV